jgi:hypothetical protein
MWVGPPGPKVSTAPAVETMRAHRSPLTHGRPGTASRFGRGRPTHSRNALASSPLASGLSPLARPFASPSGLRPVACGLAPHTNRGSDTPMTFRAFTIPIGTSRRMSFCPPTFAYVVQSVR